METMSVGEYAYVSDLLYDHKGFRPTLISHEVPINMLQMSRGFNDYDYALVHLFEDHPDYFEFYKESVAMGRRVILDNSLYELGEAFDMAEYAKWIEKLKPTYYIIPDAFWDSQVTMDLAMEWMVNYGKHIDPQIKRIGVAQGGTYAEIRNTYKFLEQICDCIAFTFKFDSRILSDEDLNLHTFLDNLIVKYPGIQISGDDLTPEDKQAACRYLVLKKLDSDGIINRSKEHHLLGLQNTTLLYESCLFPWVTSIDTSNPIITGFDGNTYYFNETIMNHGTPEHSHHAFIGNSGHPKPTRQLQDIFYLGGKEDLTWRYVYPDVMYNIRAFREVVNPSCLSAIFYGDRTMQDSYIAPNIKEYLEKNI